MAPRNRIIIDTDPGVDDILAILLAFAAKPEELEVLLLSLTFGNVEVQSCLRNVVTLFHYIEKEQTWRRENGKPEGFEALKACKPIVAVGAEEPLADQIMLADYFHGIDGLGGIHHSHPHLTPADTWKSLFKAAASSSDPEEVSAANEAQDPSHALFTPSTKPAAEEMLRLLRENEPDTITIVAIGPLTNLAIAAFIDPETFLRAKEVVVMGGAIDVPGNMTPGAEFNTYADSVAAARIFALTSTHPRMTMPPTPPGNQDALLAPYPTKLSRQLKLTLFPLDITTPHALTRGTFTAHTLPLLAPSSPQNTPPLTSPSPLATWTAAFLAPTFAKIASLDAAARTAPPDAVALQLHDPCCVWYAMAAAPSVEFPAVVKDVRVETAGQWTRGFCVVDGRGRQRMEEEDDGGDEEGEVEVEKEVVGDHGRWLGGRGNAVRVCVGSPGFDVFQGVLLGRVFGTTTTTTTTGAGGGELFEVRK
ncbi:nucleoside hydrolase [Mytilinidion resinicola]|uniref:Nucleoside hydrolase n=1 Tax=Mytilinidion resinicola TaxID=574789 RepID=A0A6A6YWJ3_9PEZI|nr:nucleoside hydrolase [Mytilinidion resinicola]KAF2813312.1 nucleoside hydrolase [Mytilinidion resinicola]